MNEAAVVDGRLVHFSVSQLREFKRCKRRWAADKCLHIPRDKDKPGQKRGTSNHKQIERYYLTGKLPTKVPAFEKAISDLAVPAPRDGCYIESPLKDLAALAVGDIALHGYSDLIIPPSPDGVARPQIWDWKNVYDFKYNADPSEDLQLLVYGLVALSRWTEWDEIDVNLAYFSTKQGSKEYDIRPAVLTRERCVREWELVVTPTVLEMAALAATKPAGFKDTEPNFASDYASCKAYGGCEFQNRCIPLAQRLDWHEPHE